MIELCILTYIAGVWLGEALRYVVYGKIEITAVTDALLNRTPEDTNAHLKKAAQFQLVCLVETKAAFIETSVRSSVSGCSLCFRRFNLR